MTTAVAYHADGYGPARPAIDVKSHHAGIDCWPRFPVDERERGWIGECVSIAYDRVQSDFWQVAAEIAEQRGLGEIAQEGRSGGWLVLTDGRDPQDPETLIFGDTGSRDPEAAYREWLAAYTALREWCEAYIADAPRKVREMAQQYAMDEAGADAARRMFATFDGRRAEASGSRRWHSRPGAHRADEMIDQYGLRPLLAFRAFKPCQHGRPLAECYACRADAIIQRS